MVTDNFLKDQIENCRKNFSNFPKIPQDHPYYESAIKCLNDAKHFLDIRSYLKKSVNLIKFEAIENQKIDTGDHQTTPYDMCVTSKIIWASGYLSLVWGGIYDNICNAILNFYRISLDRAKYDKGDDKKGSKMDDKQIDHNYGGFHSLFKDDKRAIVNIKQAELLRDKYRYFVSTYYEIRNVFIHYRESLPRTLFENKSGFIINKTALEPLKDCCRKKVLSTIDKKKDYQKLYDVNEKQIFPSDVPYDLIKIIEELEKHVDDCVGRFLYYATDFKNPPESSYSVDKQPSESSYYIGEKPGVGTYYCANCRKWKVKLDDAMDRLPPCGNCGRGQHVRYTKT